MVDLKKDRTSPARGGKPYHISCGDLLRGFALVAVRFRVLHAQDTASLHKGRTVHPGTILELGCVRRGQCH